jgi:plasmid stabilization system protein ParE
MAARKREVRWSKGAVGDLWAIVEFIAQDRPTVAKDTLRRIRERSESLHVAAEKGRIVPELERQGIREYRELIVSVWRIIYKVGPGSVDVLLVVDSRRNVEDVLLMRLSRKRL